MNDSIAALKAEASKLNMVFSPNIGTETLKARITAEKLNREANADSINNETASQRYTRLKRTATQMLRVEVTCLNSNKTQEQGVWAMGSNPIVGCIKEYIPMGVPWHISRIGYNVLKEKMFSKQASGTRGGEGKRVLTEEYQITILPELTPAELKTLKQVQQATKKLAAMDD